MYASVDDVIKSQCLDTHLVERRRMRVSTKLDLIRVQATETSLCKKLREFQNGERRPVLRDMSGRQHTWHRESIDGHAAHFQCMPGDGSDNEDDDKPSPAETEAHEEAKVSAGRLMMDNKLRVMLRCTCPDHVRHVPEPPALLPGWAKDIPNCIAAWDVDGSGEGIDVDTERWWALTNGNFRPDVGKEVDGKPHTAIEIEHSSSSKKRKRAAYEAETPKVLMLQIDSREMNRKCRNRNWQNNKCRVLVDHHPISVQKDYVCGDCLAAQDAQRQVDQAKEAAFQARKAELEKKEGPYMTTYDARESYRWLKGFVSGAHRSKEHGKPIFRFQLRPEAYDSEINKHSPYAILRVEDTVQQGLVEQLPSNKIVCVQLERRANGTLLASWIEPDCILPIGAIKERLVAEVTENLPADAFDY